jgi:predicted transcriptional regulator
MDKKLLVTDQPKTRKEIASALNISVSTLYRRLKELPIEVPGGLIPPDIQIQIYKELGYAYLVELEQESSLPD